MTQHFVRPDVQAFLDLMKANPRPGMSDAIIAYMRQMPPGSMPSLDLPVGDLATVRDVVMPGPGGDLALKLFDVRETRGPSPVVVFYHGGGFAVGSIETHAAVAAEMSRGLDLPVVSVEYRLSPEHPWPAGVDDAEASARWVAENGAAFGRAFTALVLAGDSAGGNLTAVTALALRDKPAALPVVLQFAIYPVVDSSEPTASRAEFAHGFFLDKSDMDYFDRAYAGDISDWRVSPLLADLAGMPPAVVVTASLDPLRDEGRAYAAKLKSAGVPVTFYEAEGTIHGFITYRLHMPSARDDYAKMLALAKAMLS